MATVENKHESHFFSEKDHPCWQSQFPPEVRVQQVSDDLLAGRSVAAVLVAIVTGGALLGAFGVLLCL